MHSALMVVGQRLMAATSEAVAVMKENIGSLRSSKKQESYLRRIDELYGECEKRYQQVREKFGP